LQQITLADKLMTRLAAYCLWNYV